MIKDFINKIDKFSTSSQTLAYIGDAVYDLYIRLYLVSKNNGKTGYIHKQATKFVSAKAQSYIIDNIYNDFSEDEIEVFKRGRNHNIDNIKKNVDITEYKKATGFECIIGYLYLNNFTLRLEELIKSSINIIESKECI